jgi:anti-sigma-K factor RskA
MVDHTIPGPEDRDVLAAELALGLLDGKDRARALRLKLADATFAAQVEAWSVRLEPLGGDFAEATPPELWPAIERRLGARAIEPLLAPVDHRLRAWRFGAIGSGLIAASLAAVLLFRPVPQPVEIVRAPQQLVLAQLDDAASGALLAANYDPQRGALKIRAIQLPSSALAPELWVIPADGVPRSLGLVAARGISDVPVAPANRKLMHDGATLAITMEPAATAPHAAPSSAPIAAGKISTI